MLVNIKQSPNVQEALQNSPSIFGMLIIILTVYPLVILHRIKGMFVYFMDLFK